MGNSGFAGDFPVKELLQVAGLRLAVSRELGRQISFDRGSHTLERSRCGWDGRSLRSAWTQ